MTNLPTRNNNPGDLKDPSTGQFNVFNSPQEGFAALKADLQAKISGNTRTGLGPNSNLQQLASVWAPDSDGNNSTQYAQHLASKLGVAPTASLASLNVDDLATAISGNEGYQGDGSSTTAKLTSQQFAEKIKAKYPQYAQVDDATLAQKVLAKYPQYQSSVSDAGQATPQDYDSFPSTKLQVPADSAIAQPQSPGFFQGLSEDLSGTNPQSIGTQLGNTAKGVGNFLFPAVGDVINDVKGTNTKTPLQQAGDVGSSLLSASTLIPGVDAITGPLKAAEVAGEGANAASKAGLLAQAGKNAALGGAFGVTGSLGQGNTDPGKIAEDTALGAGTGGLLGAAGGLLGNKIGNIAGEDAASRLTSQKDRLKTLTKVFNDNSRNTATGATDPIKTLEQNGLLKGLKVVGSKVDASALTNQQDTGTIDNLIEDHSSQASALIDSLKGGVDTDEMQKKVMEEVASNPAIRDVGGVSKAQAEVKRIFEDYKNSYGDRLPYKAIDNIRVGMNRVYDPTERDVARTIGDAARDYLYNGDGANTALKSAMANEAELIRAKNFVEKLHGTTVPGGQLGKYFADIIGAGVGEGLGTAVGGPLGGAIGTGVGGMATHKLGGLIQGQYFNPIGSRVAGSLQKAALSGIGKVARGTAKAGLLREAGSI